ncbi:hypothetical protein [Nocardioides sp.]|uniref:hypothetical protein n=1 Tax=Nocardioides sp. TaxID=35761 RepID=UPI002BB36E42|nr:hypothetical protein [Nocardioides sp.]HSX66539.1 hypothetical protein [Nocardioides sp.]
MTEQSYWFDVRPLEGGRAASMGRLRPGARSQSIERFAVANGLQYAGTSRPGDEEHPISGAAVSRWVTTCEDVVRWDGPQRVEFGNSGRAISVNLKPTRFGFIAVEHGIELPDFRLTSRSLGTISPARAVSIGLGVGAMVLSAIPGGDGDFGTPMGKAPATSRSDKRLDRSRDLGYDVWLAPEDEERVEAFLRGSGDFWKLLSASFDVHVADGWLVLESLHGDLATLQPADWAWAFSTASRVLDQIGAWSGDAAVVSAARRATFYTELQVGRP